MKLNIYGRMSDIYMSSSQWEFLNHYIKSEGIALKEFIKRAESRFYILWSKGCGLNASDIFIDYLKMCYRQYLWRARNVANGCFDDTPEQSKTAQFIGNRQDAYDRWEWWQKKHWSFGQKWRWKSSNYICGVKNVRICTFGDMQNIVRRNDTKWMVDPESLGKRFEDVI
jgi:hypothetical protein